MRKADGTPVRCRALRAFDDLTTGRAASLVAAIDITERKRAEDELRQAREFLHTVIENVPLPIVVKNAADLTYVLRQPRRRGAVRPAARDRRSARPRYELLPKPQADDHRRARPGNDSPERRPVRRGGADARRRRATRFLTSLRVPIRDAAGKPRYILGVMDDVTERKQQEDELRRTRTFLDTIIENMPAILTVKDARDLRYVLVNRAAEAMLRHDARGHDRQARERGLHRTGRERRRCARDRDVIAVRHAAASSTSSRSRRRATARALLSTKKLAGPRRGRRGAIRPQPVRGRDRPQARARADRAHGASRRAHRSAEPRRLQRAACRDAARARRRRRSRSRSEHRPRPVQGSQRRVRSRGRRRAAVRDRAAARRGGRRARSSRGSAATSSR